MEAGTARITVARKPGGYVDRARAYKVLIDGQEVGKLKAGESHMAEVPPGSHEVQMKVDWASSPAIGFDLGPGAEARLECAAGSNNPFVAALRTFVSPKRYLSLERTG